MDGQNGQLGASERDYIIRFQLLPTPLSGIIIRFQLLLLSLPPSQGAPHDGSPEVHQGAQPAVQQPRRQVLKE